MKTLLVSVMVAMLCVGVVGCDKPEAEDVPTAFDAKVDGPAVLPAVEPTPLLMKTGPVAAEEAEPVEVVPVGAPAAPAAPAAPEPTAPADPEAAVRAMLEAAVEKAEQGEVKPLVDMMMDEQRAPVEALAAKFEPVAAAAMRLKETAEAKWGKTAEEIEETLNPGAAAEDENPVNQLSMKVVSPTLVQVVNPAGAPVGVEFVLVDGRWRVKLDDSFFDILSQIAQAPVLGKIAEALTGMTEEMIAGIEDGSITEANFNEMSTQAANQAMDPLKMEMMQLVMPIMMKFAGQAGFGGPAGFGAPAAGNAPAAAPMADW